MEAAFAETNVPDVAPLSQTTTILNGAGSIVLCPNSHYSTHDLSFGDSEGTFLLRANFAYIVGKHRQNRILFGYQYKEAEFRDDDVVTDFSYQGPMAGFNFHF